MVKSMTAYGRAECQAEDAAVLVEIKSVNHRYRDVVIRLPKALQPMEDELRAEVSSKVRRGRVEVSIQVQNNGNDACAYALKLNAPLVRAYVKVFDELADQFGFDQKVSLEGLCQMKDVLLVEPKTLEEDKIQPALREALRQALASYEEMRRREGEAIERDFVKRIQLLKEHVEEIEASVPRIVAAYGKRLRENVGRMLQDVAVDEARLAQEAAFFAERSDVTEEVVRIKSHLKQFGVYLALDDALGRRLDFLIQEINREVNTVSAKASDSAVSFLAVEMKAELEKLREQVQNVE